MTVSTRDSSEEWSLTDLFKDGSTTSEDDDHGRWARYKSFLENKDQQRVIADKSTRTYTDILSGGKDLYSSRIIAVRRIMDEGLSLPPRSRRNDNRAAP
jgi:hypothetical protein